MKYDANLTELKNLLPNAKNILIVLPAGSNIDQMAAGLALFLSLNQQGKEVSIVCDDTIKVAQSHLFGINHVQKNIPQTSGGNFVITLEGVAVPDPNDPKGGKVPALQTMDYFVSGNNLDLVFNLVPGQTFQPARIYPHQQGSGFNVIIVIGTANLNALGSVYAQNQQIFSGVHTVNIDNQITNTSFGQTNVIDGSASSISEQMADIIPSLGLPLDQDTASNLLAGIFDATANLTSQKVNPDTYVAVGNLLRAGGQKPALAGVSAPVSTAQPMSSQPTPTPAAGPPFDWSVLMPPDHNQPSVTNTAPTQPTPSESEPVPSPEERPSGEGVISADTVEAEPGWLTPKVFKGTSVG